jgi:hypothetical protein
MLHHGTGRGGFVQSPAAEDEVRGRWFRARDEGIPRSLTLTEGDDGTRKRKEDIQFVHGGKGEKMDANISFGCGDECVGGTASRKAMQETN